MEHMWFSQEPFFVISAGPCRLNRHRRGKFWWMFCAEGCSSVQIEGIIYFKDANYLAFHLIRLSMFVDMLYRRNLALWQHFLGRKSHVPCALYLFVAVEDTTWKGLI